MTFLLEYDKKECCFITEAPTNVNLFTFVGSIASNNPFPIFVQNIEHLHENPIRE